ncbi:MAG: dihydroorotate dehydrogenase electron transfer subunit [Caldilineaceae bacterium]
MRLNLPTAARILSIRQDNYRTRTYTLDLTIDAAPGQFVMLWLPRFDEKPFSLVAANPVTVMITAVGPFTRLVHELTVGDKLWVRGPFGQGFTLPPTSRRPLLVGGGYGVAPLLWLAQEAAARASVEQVTAVIGARTAADLLYADNLAALESRSQGRLRTVLTTEDGSQGAAGRVTDLLATLLTTPAPPDALFACGPHGMLHALEAMAAEHTLPAQLSWEAYMRCAVGICGACEHRGALLCLDGPVLASPERTATA